MKNIEFEIRQYGRTELAQVYSPDITPAAAWKKLKVWIDYHPTLGGSLEELGYQSNRQRIFTPAQVEVIVRALGEP